MIELLAPFLEYIIGAAVAVAGLLGLYLSGKSSGRAKERRVQMEADNKRADEIRKEARDARRDHDADDRPVDDKLRDLGGLRDPE